MPVGARAILASMIRLAVALLSVAVPISCVGQTSEPSGPQTSAPQIAKLPPAQYPSMARAAHVSGNVELRITLQPGGTPGSIEVLNGPPMLRQPAVEFAKQTEFKCADCSGDAASFPLNIKYELGEPIYCDPPDASYPRISQDGNTITIVAQPFGTCDPAATTTFRKARSAKCLYLWRCGWSQVD